MSGRATRTRRVSPRHHLSLSLGELLLLLHIPLLLDTREILRHHHRSGTVGLHVLRIRVGHLGGLGVLGIGGEGRVGLVHDDSDFSGGTIRGDTRYVLCSTVIVRQDVCKTAL